jgi:uncharacterized protein YutE (UPF0331/DUF86 family)
MSEAIEAETLQRLVPELEAEGYEVFVHPNKPLVPAFLGNFPPDAIARRADKNLVIEVLRQSPLASQKLERVAALLKGQENWELRVVWIESTKTQASLPVQGADEVDSRLAEISELAAARHVEAAMLLAWATFEALARGLLTKEFERPQTPGRLVQVLAGNGHLTPTEADQLRTLAEKRNRLIHGGLDVRVSENELQNFISVLEVMKAQLAH